MKLFMKIVKILIKRNSCYGHALGNARYRGGKQHWLFIHQSHDKNVITVRILYSKRLLEIA